MKSSEYLALKGIVNVDEYVGGGYEEGKSGRRGYNPIAKDYDLTQILSDTGASFKALHVMIHLVKSWIRTTYSWVSENNINRYFDEFCYRINRSQSKDTIFNNLINRMVKADKNNVMMELEKYITVEFGNGATNI